MSHEFVRGESVGEKISEHAHEQEINLRSDQTYFKNTHDATVYCPKLGDGVTHKLGIRQIFCLVVLDRILYPRHNSVREEIAHARVCKSGANQQEPLVPRVYGKRHEGAVIGRAERHEVRVHEAHALQQHDHAQHPQHEKKHGESLVVEQKVKTAHENRGSRGVNRKRRPVCCGTSNSTTPLQI